jgi:hypothetical protein
MFVLLRNATIELHHEHLESSILTVMRSYVQIILNANLKLKIEANTAFTN